MGHPLQLPDAGTSAPLLAVCSLEQLNAVRIALTLADHVDVTFSALALVDLVSLTWR